MDRIRVFEGKGPRISISESWSSAQSRFSSAVSTLDPPVEFCRFAGLVDDNILVPTLLGEEEIYLETRNAGSLSACAIIQDVKTDNIDRELMKGNLPRVELLKVTRTHHVTWCVFLRTLPWSLNRFEPENIPGRDWEQMTSPGISLFKYSGLQHRRCHLHYLETTEAGIHSRHSTAGKKYERVRVFSLTRETAAGWCLVFTACPQNVFISTFSEPVAEDLNINRVTRRRSFGASFQHEHSCVLHPGYRIIFNRLHRTCCTSLERIWTRSQFPVTFCSPPTSYHETRIFKFFQGYQNCPKAKSGWWVVSDSTVHEY